MALVWGGGNTGWGGDAKRTSYLPDNRIDLSWWQNGLNILTLCARLEIPTCLFVLCNYLVNTQ